MATGGGAIFKLNSEKPFSVSTLSLLNPFLLSPCPPASPPSEYPLVHRLKTADDHPHVPVNE